MSNRSARPRRARIRHAGALVALAAGLTASTTSMVAAGTSAPAHASAAVDVVGLHKGASGEAVRALQQALVKVGVGVVGGVDGYFGSATESSVRYFQRQQGLSVTGVVSERTAAALGLGGAAASSSSSTPPAPAGAGSQLGLGSSGDAVRQLQQRLIDVGFPIRGGADGFFGGSTADAVRDFQEAQGYKITGRTNPATLKALGLTAAAPAGNQAAAAPAASSSPPATTGGLQRGARGPAVAELQQRIITLGWTLRGGADGVFGAATQSRVISFQEANGLPRTGVIDERTARLLGLSGSAPAASSGGSSGATASGFAKFNERGSRVVALQSALLAAGIPVPGGADGVFGSSTAGSIMTFQRARGLTVSGRVDEATAAALGLSAAQEPAAGPRVDVALEARPVQGPCDYRDSWLADRGNGRLHLGTDIIAAEGNQLYAVATGTITQTYADAPGSRSGNALKLARADGTYFFYGHLAAIAPGIGAGTSVTAGQLVGYLGRTGNAGTPHLHLEVHPGGGAAVNPSPIVGAVGAC